MKNFKIILLGVLATILINPSIWSQNLLEVEGELTVNPTNSMINVHGNFIENLADPQTAQDAATKSYVDNAVMNYFLSLPNGLETLLNAGETPLNLINAGAPLLDFIGLNHAGGIIFYMDPSADGTGLVSAPEDQSTGEEWGCFGTDLPNVPNVTSNPPIGLGADIGDGMTNTTNILIDCPTATAALLCTGYTGGGFSDWFLPSAGELNLMWENLADSDGNNNNTGPSDPNNIGGFADSFYWSSSEFDDNLAWVQDFIEGIQVNGVKSDFINFNRVRAIRAF